MNLSIEYNGVTLLPENGYTITAVDGLSGLPIRASEEFLANAHGGRVYTTLYGMRTIAIEGVIHGTSVQDYFDKRRALDTAFASAGDMTITNWNGDIRVVEVKVIQPPMIREQSGNVTRAEFRVQVRSGDPFLLAEDTTEYRLDVAGVTGTPIPTAVPLAIEGDSNILTINNSGDVAYIPEIRIYGNISTPAITNMTTGESYRIDNDVTGTNYVSVSWGNDGITVMLNGVTDWISYLKGEPLELAQGANSLALQGSGSPTGYAIIYARNRYLGI